LLERARVDPFVNKPVDSSFTITCKIVAENYANHLQKYVDDIYISRESLLTQPIVFHHWYPDPYSAPVDEWHFEDHYTGYKSPIIVDDKGTKNVKTGKQKVDAARAAYYKNTFEPTIVKDLAGGRAIIPEWRKIYHVAKVKAK
jgi:hypothetical protein